MRELPVVFGSHGIVLQGKIILPPDASASHSVPGAVLCHGFGSDRSAMESGALLLARKGVAAIIFDLRGHGTSAGALDGNFTNDVIDAWQTLTDLPEVDKSRVAFIGHSLGALSSIVAAGKIRTAKAVIALSCPFEIDSRKLQGSLHFLLPFITLIWRMTNWVSGIKVKVDWRRFLESWLQSRLSAALADLDQCPKLFVFGANDKLTPYRRFVHLYNKAPEPKQKMLTGGFHNTPLVAEMLLFEWVGWVVSALKNHGIAIQNN